MKFMRMKVDKQSGTLMILAVVVICFMGTMFLINNSIGKSYALPSSGGSSVPSEIVIDADEVVDGYYTGTTLQGLIENFATASGVTETEKGNLKLKAPFSRITNVEGESTFDLYCLDRVKDVGPDTYEVYTKDGNPVDLTGYYDGALYILVNAYSDNTVTKEQYFVTQHAIWYYLATTKDNDGKLLDTDPSAEKYANAIDTAAKNGDYLALKIKELVAYATKKANVDNTITIIGGDSVKLNLTENGKYLESSDLRVEATTNDISYFKGFTVDTGSDSVIVVDSSGNTVTKNYEFKNGNNFRIRIPVDSTENVSSIIANIRVEGIYDEQRLYYYVPTTTDNQRVLYVNSMKMPFYAEADLNFVKVSKQDVTNGKELAGAKLKIEKLNDNGTYNVVSEWTSTGEPRYIFLEPGFYTLTEIVAPEGYELSREVIEFTVTSDAQPTKVVVMNNTPYVDTPDTASGIPLYVYIVGALVLISGIAVVYVSMRPKKG